MLLFALFSLAFHKAQYSFLILGDFEWRIQALPYASIFSFGTAAYLDLTSIRARRISATVFSLSYRFFEYHLPFDLFHADLLYYQSEFLWEKATIMLSMPNRIR